MAIVRLLSSLTLRTVLGGVCESAGLDREKASPDFLLFALTARFRDHSNRLGDALQKSSDRAWSAVEIALAGDSWWQRIKGLLGQREDQVFAQQVRAFVEAAALPELAGKSKFREACLAELKTARKQGLLTQAPDAPDPLARYVDPPSLLAAEAQVLENVAGLLQEAGLGNLAYMLSLQARQGQPLLVVAVRYFFRRAIEDDPRLFQGLTFTQLDQLQKGQADAFDGLHDALAQQAHRLEELLGDLREQLAQTHQAVTQTHETVLDVQAELTRQGQHNRDIYQAVLDLQRRLDLAPREVRPRDSFSIRSDQERELVRRVIARYRELPAQQRDELPALLNAVGKLEMAAGYFEAAQEDFTHVAGLVQDERGKGEAHFNAYRTALERRDWDTALNELTEALKADTQRFTPFPVGKYQPRRILGAGGFGVAFLCRHEQLDAEVVVKTLVSEELDRDVDQVFTEAKTLWQLDHPSIVRLLDCGYTFPSAKSRPYFVMHYFEGSTLEEHVQRHGPLTVEQMSEVARQMAEGLKAAHSRGILHRDIKPANVMVRADPGDPGASAPGGWQVKLIDFGLALSQKAIANAGTVKHAQSIVGSSIAGTLEYAAPEQMGKLPGVKVGTSADIYGLAKMCCFALFETTEPTFQDWQRLPRGWAELLGDCLNKNPEKRPAGMAAVLERLKTLGTGSPVVPLLPCDFADVPAISEPEQKKPGTNIPAAQEALAKLLKGRTVSKRTDGPCDLEGRLLDLFNATVGVLPSGAIYVQPNIAAKKIANARTSCSVPPDEKVLALIDCTTFGSASDAIVLGLQGVYYHNAGGNVPDPGFVAYAEFPQITFATAWLNCVTLGKSAAGEDRYCNKGGATMPRDKLIELFGRIRAELTEPPRPVPVVDLSNLPERIHAILKDQTDLIDGSYGYFVSPDIPARKVNGATKGCAIPEDEKILALIDCTVFGSAGDALVFGQRGFYYHNLGGNVPDPGEIPYAEFPSLTFTSAWLNCVKLGADRYCNKSGSTVSREKIIEILNAIRQAVVDGGG